MSQVCTISIHRLYRVVTAILTFYYEYIYVNVDPLAAASTLVEPECTCMQDIESQFLKGSD